MLNLVGLISTILGFLNKTHTSSTLKMLIEFCLAETWESFADVDKSKSNQVSLFCLFLFKAFQFSS